MALCNGGTSPLLGKYCDGEAVGLVTGVTSKGKVRRRSVLLGDRQWGNVRLIFGFTFAGQPSCRRLSQLAVAIMSVLCSSVTGSVDLSSLMGVVGRVVWPSVIKGLVGGNRPLDADIVL